jgi:hypothetical protein
MKPSNYFSNARDFANERFLGADGWEDADAWENAFGDEMPADSVETAAAADPMGSKGESQPYIITLTAGSLDVSDVELLDAGLRQFSSTVVGITFSYDISGITYQQFLASIASGKPFEVGQIRLSASNSSSSVAIQQVQETVTVSEKDINGNAFSKPLIPSLDAYQYTQTIIDLYHRFLVDAMTSVKIKNIYANTTLRVYLYPSSKVNQFKQLKGQATSGGVTKYSDPKTNKVLAKGKALGQK